jgi:hypothetical protein
MAVTKAIQHGMLDLKRLERMMLPGATKRRIPGF